MIVFIVLVPGQLKMIVSDLSDHVFIGALYVLLCTLRLHYNMVVGSTVKNPRYNGKSYIHATFVQIDQNR